MRILIAEDDYTSRAILSAVLKKNGHEVVETVDGLEAWEEIQKPDAPRMAILDWMMPEMDGVEVCRRIRSMATTDPPYLILLTARGDENSVVHGLDSGANDYLTKPFRSDELRARIRVGQRVLEVQSGLNVAKDALSHEAAHDALTGVFNRRAILDGLSRELSRAKRQSSTLSVGLCDIDFFKHVNDTYGHLVGDDVLKGFALAVKSKLRDYDLFGRYGGEEFLVVAPGSKGLPEESLYERLRLAVAGGEIQTRNGGLAITMSVGVAGGTGADTVDELLATADAAMYRAKQEGRNRVAYADRSDTAR